MSDSQAAAALVPPPAHIDPQAEFAKLRAWVVEHCVDPQPIRKSAYQMAMSAFAHALIKFGPDERMNTLTARDVMVLLGYTNGPMAEYLMRIAYFRSIIEGEHAIYERFNQSLFIAECRAWYWTIAEAMMGKAPDPEHVTVWLEKMSGEEKQVARLIIARVFPDVAHIDWLSEVPDTTAPQHARLAAELCKILLAKREYHAVIQRYLREHPHVRYSVPDGELP